MWRGIIEEFREHLPVTPQTPVVTLREGNTPLLFAKRLSEKIGGGIEIYLKIEGCNPTGSFKDRGMTLAISKAVEEKSKAVICASTGNTSASAAAYAAAAGIRCMVLLPHGSIAMGKLVQALMHGARVVAIRGNFDEALKHVRTISEKFPVTLVNSVNPYRLEGQKTAAYEVVRDLGEAPDYHALPVGNAGNITAYWKGYQEAYQKKLAGRKPILYGFQAEGAAPLVTGRPVPEPRTIASAIRIGHPYSWKSALAARDESGGTIEAVSDNEILEAYHLLAELEGVFCEPASAASVAGVLKKSRTGGLDQKGKRVVCTLTGHGLKDPDCAVSHCPKPLVVDAQEKAIWKALGI